MNKIPHTLFLILIFNFSNAVDNKWNKLVKNLDNNTFLIEDVNYAEKLLLTTKNHSKKIEIYLYLGKFYKKFEFFDKSYHYLNSGLKIAKKSKSIKSEATFTDNLGSLFFILKNYQKSEIYYNSAIKLYKQNRDYDGMLRCKGNLALFQVKKGNKEKALFLFNEIINDKNVTDQIKNNALLNIGAIYLELKKPSVALEYLKKIESFEKLNKDTLFKTKLFLNLAECYYDLQNYSSSLDYLKDSETLLEKVPSLELEGAIYKMYAEIYNKTNQHKLAYKNLLMYNQISNRFTEIKEKIKVDELEMIEKIKNNEKDIILKEHKIELLTEEKSNASLKFWIVLLLSILLILLIFIIIKIKDFKLIKLKNDIQITENKMDYIQTNSDKMVLGIYHINDFLETIKSDLKSLKIAEENLNNKNLIKKIILDIQNFAITNDYKEKLLNKVDTEFIYKLDLNFNNLTEDEKKICTLIFLEFKNKEIASMLNLSIRSIENHRYRVRKKIKKETDLSLYCYIKSL